MEYMDPVALTKAAPAAQRLRRTLSTAVRKRQLDTQDWIAHADRLGYRPYAAFQGTPHSDAKSKHSGRHLVVLKHANGSILALLNSHFTRRKAWMAVGVAYGLKGFLLGAAVPVQRWRGLDGPVDATLSHLPAVQALTHRFKTDPEMTVAGIRAYTHELCTRMAGTKAPDATDLRQVVSEGDETTRWNVMCRTFDALLDGGLKPAKGEGRKLKPMKGPETLMHASNQVFGLMAEQMRRRGETTIALPFYLKT